MTRNLILATVVLGFAAFAVNPAVADDLGVGKPKNSTSSSTQSVSSDSTEAAWYEAVLAWFESDDAA